MQTVVLLQQEYSLCIRNSCIPNQYHYVTKRYSDFAALDTVLKGYGMDFSLPPKKVFGKMDSDFIEQRQCALQVFIRPFVESQFCGRIYSQTM